MEMKNWVKNKVAAGIATGMALSVTAPAAFAQAAGGDPFTAAVSAISEKVGVYGAALVGVAAIGVVFTLAIKYVKRLPRAG